MVAEKKLYGSGMTEFDDDIGVLLKKLDDLGIADNKIVLINTDNGAETFSWPDGGTILSGARRTQTGKADTGPGRYPLARAD